MPTDIRKVNYDKTRARIFGGNSDEKNKSDEVKHNYEKKRHVENRNRKKILKLREKKKQHKILKKSVLETIARDRDTKDPRPYVTVNLEGKAIKGLLDSGATVSLLGRHCRELVEELGLEIYPYFSNVSTASGQRHRILGKIVVDIEYNNRINKINLFLCPDLSQELYLGTDFWRVFDIAPQIFPVEEVNADLQRNIHGDSDNTNPNMHILSEDQQNKLDKVIKLFPTFEEKGLGCTKLEKHAIKLVEGANPVKDKHYPLSPAVQEIVYHEIDNMLALKVIEESDSSWSNRTTVVRKPGKNRFCLDARKLNALTIKDAYPLQNIDGILSRIDQTHYISSVDLKYAFWQIELEEEAKQYTAFTVPGRPLYQFRVMPFGLCNAAQRLCRLMDKVIPGRLKSNVFVYLDDLLIIANDFEYHLKLLKEVAECLQKANLTIG